MRIYWRPATEFETFERDGVKYRTPVLPTHAGRRRLLERCRKAARKNWTRIDGATWEHAEAGVYVLRESGGRWCGYVPWKAASIGEKLTAMAAIKLVNSELAG